MEKLETSGLIEVTKSERHAYGARDPPRVSKLTDRGERLVEVAKDEGYRTDLCRRAEEVHENQRKVDRVAQRVQRLEEVLAAEELVGSDVSLAELVDHVVELEDYLYEWTEVAEQQLEAL